MVFSSVIFLFGFLPAVILIHSFGLILAHRFSYGTTLINLLLFCSSIFFYAWGEQEKVAILISCTVFTFVLGRKLETTHNKVYLWLGVTGNILLLAYFKYAMLFAAPVLSMLSAVFPSHSISKEAISVALPLGISFYVFQAISYLIDVARRDVVASRNFINFGCYLTMFPQLVAGPIVRYKQVQAELQQRVISLNRFNEGVSRFIIGLAKKVLIADTLGRVVDAAFAVQNGELSAFGAWVGIICYTLQIYYDFSGYSDMAIGMGKMLGFSFPENFNYPYIATSIRNFWQRWHISLSCWFRDYLYISLGGNKKEPIKTYRNLFIVFLLCGFWHGASWTFMAWGAYYGIFLIVERFFLRFTIPILVFIKHLYVILVIIFGWVLFRADSFSHALFYYQALLGFFDESIAMNKVWLVLYGYDVLLALIFGILFSIPVAPWIKKYIESKAAVESPMIMIFVKGAYHTMLLGLLLITFMPVFGATYSAFIYFRF